MKFYAQVVLISGCAMCMNGCAKAVTRNEVTTTYPTSSNASSSPGGSVTPSSTSGVVTSTLQPHSSIPPTSTCPGKRLGQYSWGTDLWSQGATVFSNFFASQAGKDWACGDIYINIGDYSAPAVIAFENDLVVFIQSYRASSQNLESVVWLTYGDVVSGDGSLMSLFVDTFFTWASSLSLETVGTLGKIGLSFDVEHMTPDSTQEVLQKVQSLKASTKFSTGSLLVQHTIEGNVNTVGTDYVMKYADSALMMLYRNYMNSTVFSDDSNILSRAAWMLTQQCLQCLNDTYAEANYIAKLTIMIEASCSPSDYCAKISFCADSGGAQYAWDTLQQMQAGMFSTGLVTNAQFDRLFNPLTTYAAHDWYWFRCYTPISDSVSYPECSAYPAAAQTCRDTIGPLATTTSSP